MTEADELYILGNGFDIHHGIQSQYKDYRNWLENNYPEILKDINEIYGHPDNLWWNAFEDNLTVIKKDFNDSVNKMTDAQLVSELNRLAPKFLDEFDSHGYPEHAVLVDRYAVARAQSLVEQIIESFQEWVPTIDIDKSPASDFSINPDGFLLALVFNYTRSLEQIYQVDPAYVNHIHGKTKYGDDDADWPDPHEFILGHGMTMTDIMDRDYKNSFSPQKEVREMSCFSDDNPENNTAILECYAALADLKKPVDEIIEINIAFWDSLHSVNKVIIAGMSFSPIDKKYIDTVFKNVKKSAEAVIYCHTSEDVDRAKKYMAKVNHPFNLVMW